MRFVFYRKKEKKEISNCQWCICYRIYWNIIINDYNNDINKFVEETLKKEIKEQ